MRVFRLQKYDPSFYDSAGRFVGCDWTHVSDVGKVFSGRQLTPDAYLESEDRYLMALDALMHRSKVDALKVFGDYRGPRGLSHIAPILWGIPMEEALRRRDGEWLSGAALKTFCRLCLRDLQGDALSDEKSFFLDFTGDYYVHVGTLLAPVEAKREAEGVGLFLVELGELGAVELDNEAYMRLLPEL